MGKTKGRYGFDALKVYVPREEMQEGDAVELEDGLARVCEGQDDERLMFRVG